MASTAKKRRKDSQVNSFVNSLTWLVGGCTLGMERHHASIHTAVTTTTVQVFTRLLDVSYAATVLYTYILTYKLYLYVLIACYNYSSRVRPGKCSKRFNDILTAAGNVLEGAQFTKSSEGGPVAGRDSVGDQKKISAPRTQRIPKRYASRHDSVVQKSWKHAMLSQLQVTSERVHALSNHDKTAILARHPLITVMARIKTLWKHARYDHGIIAWLRAAGAKPDRQFVVSY